MSTLTNIASLRGQTSGSAGVVTLEGYTTAGDGGGGDFVYVSGDTTSVDNGVTIIVDSASDRWYRTYSGLIDVRWAGAKCDGTTNDHAAVVRAAAVGPITFAAGVCYIANTMTIGVYATAWPGQIDITTGKVLTFNQGFDAPIQQVFLNGVAGQGTISFNPQYYVAGYPEWWGAKCDGITDDSAAVMSAAAAGPIKFAAGVCYINTNLIISALVSAWPGQIKLGTDITLTFSGGFYAPVEQIFLNATAGEGTVTFNSNFFAHGYPEWWGAVTNSSSIDCSAALSACLVACPVTQLQPADYWIAGTWSINTPWRTVRGVGPNAQGGTPVTRIVCASASIDLVQVGPDSQPVRNSDSDFLQGVTLDQFTITRSVAPNLPPATGGDVRNGVSGLRAQWLNGCYFTNLWINESINNTYILGNVACYYEGLHLSRTLAGAGGGSGPDRYYGVFLDSSADIGLAGGNASVYLSYISSGSANVSINSLMYAYDGFTDTYWSYLESSGHASGMMLNGTTNTGAGSPTEDIHIQHAIFDGLSGYGIYINQGNAGTNITISQCYFEGSQYGVFVNGTFGATSIVGCQFDNLSVGIYALSSLGVTDTNCNFTDCLTSVQWQDSNSCESAASILSYRSATAHGSGAVVLISAARCVWRSKITGPANSVPSGAVVLTIDGGTGHACDYNEINCSGIDPGCLTGGSANKLVLGGTQITVTGITSGAPANMTHNVVYGVMN